MEYSLDLPKILFHEHCFTDFDVPNQFLPLGLVRWLSEKDGRAKKIGKFLNEINPDTHNDIFDKYARFMETGALRGGQREIIANMLLNQPKNAIFVILPMDMSQMCRGKVRRPYERQLEELFQIREELYGDRMKIFFMADPRNPEMLRLFKKHDWDGIKIYPLLGYYPQDKGLSYVYDYANERSLCVVSHCTRENSVYYSGSHNSLVRALKEHNPNPKTFNFNKNLVWQFAQPKNYRGLAEKYKNIYWDLAHFGGYDSIIDEHGFFSDIELLMHQYERICADISFSSAYAKTHPVIKRVLEHPIIGSKCIGGLDSYMYQSVAEESAFNEVLRNGIGEENYFKAYHVNARPLLGLK